MLLPADAILESIAFWKRKEKKISISCFARENLSPISPSPPSVGSRRQKFSAFDFLIRSAENSNALKLRPHDVKFAARLKNERCCSTKWRSGRGKEGGWRSMVYVHRGWQLGDIYRHPERCVRYFKIPAARAAERPYWPITGPASAAIFHLRGFVRAP